MKAKKIRKLIDSGEIILTTKSAIIEAVKQECMYLYDEVSDFDNNRFLTASEKEYERLTDSKLTDLADEIIDFLTDTQ